MFKLTTKTPEQRDWRFSVFVVGFEHTSNLFLVFVLSALNKKMLTGLELLFTIIKVSCQKFYFRLPAGLFPLIKNISEILLKFSNFIWT